MANCPHCGRKLHLYDWRPECPGCGVNLVFYNSNQALLDESEKSEIEHAKFQPKVDRAKTATIGSKEGIIRMVLFLIPIAALFLPLFKIAVSGKAKNFNAIDIYNAFSSLDIGGVLRYISPVGGVRSNISPVVIAAALIAIPAVCCIVFTIMQIASGTKKGLKRNIVLSGISTFLVLASIINLCVFSAKPLRSYTDLVLNEATMAANGNSQEAVDSAVQKLRDLYNDDTLDKAPLEKAIENGEKALLSADKSGLSGDEIQLLKDAVENGKAALTDGEADINSLRNAAAEINSASNKYSTLQELIYVAATALQDSEDGSYPEDCYKNICEETEKAKVYLQNTIDEAKKIENDGKYSENSFASLGESITAAQECLDTLKKGEPVVDLMDDDGSGNKTVQEIAEETAEVIQSKFDDLNNNICALTDISAITPLIEKATADSQTGALEETAGEVKAAPGIGIFLLLALYIAQLIYNIILNKKGIDVKYTQCLIGGLPSEEYFRYVEEGMSKADIQRKMLVALAKLEEEHDLNGEEETDNG